MQNFRRPQGSYRSKQSRVCLADLHHVARVAEINVLALHNKPFTHGEATVVNQCCEDTTVCNFWQILFPVSVSETIGLFDLLHFLHKLRECSTFIFVFGVQRVPSALSSSILKSAGAGEERRMRYSCRQVAST